MAYQKSFVSAPAGSGKTATIVRRYLWELAQGRSVSEIVAITFTRKAAAELIERIAEVLRAHADGPLPEPLQRLYGDVVEAPNGGGLSREAAGTALEELPFAPVTTVDSFVQSLVQEYLLYSRFTVHPGEYFPIDGPVEVDPDSDELFEAAARDALAADHGHAEHLYKHMTEMAARAAVATLAGDDGSDLLVTADGAPVSWRELTAAQQPNPDMPAASDLVGAIRDQVFGGDETKLAKKLACSEKWTQASQHAIAELSSAAWALSRAARRIALERMATLGRSTHAELLRAATDLCSRAAGNEPDLKHLVTRFKALLVDEVQDTSPDQIAFYQAFSSMAGLDERGEPRMSRLFVGDRRQSIYRFRGADPHGWQELLERARADDRAELNMNFRSSRLLVEFQRDVFRALSGRHPRALNDIDQVEVPEDAPQGLFDARGQIARPVLIAASADEGDHSRGAIALFARRLGAEWSPAMLGGAALPTGAAATETAAVLVQSWNKGRLAIEELKRFGIRARLSGFGEVLKARVATDVRLFLEALLDATDDIAWMGVLKHPSVGLTDHGLWVVKPFGRLLRHDWEGALGEDLQKLRPDDRDRLSRVLPVLRAAASRLGREPTVRVLDQMIGELHWRELVAAGPEGLEAVADLDLVLDIIASFEEEAVDPQAVVDSLGVQDRSDDLPSRRFETGRCCVEVMTIFQAKGLQFDHVCMPELDSKGGAGGRSDPGAGGGKVAALRVAGVSVLEVKIDPAGRSEPAFDPASELLRELSAIEAQEERIRLVYVGFTRAKQSLTFGLKLYKQDSTAKGCDRLVGDALALHAEVGWHGDCGDYARYFRMGAEQDACLTRPDLEQETRRPSRGAALGGVPARTHVSIPILSPSDGNREHERIDAVAQHFMAQRTIVRGNGAPALPPGLGGAFDPRVRGDVIHGWFEAWRFSGEPDAVMAQQYLEDRWPALAKQGGLADSLVEIARGVLAIPGLEGLLGVGDGSLDFECGLIAPLGTGLYVGRADLLIRHPDGSVSVVDFKGGWGEWEDHAPPTLAEYARQLGAYAAMLEVSGKRVASTSLVYVGAPAWVHCEVPQP